MSQLPLLDNFVLDNFKQSISYTSKSKDRYPKPKQNLLSHLENSNETNKFQQTHSTVSTQSDTISTTIILVVSRFIAFFRVILKQVEGTTVRNIGLAC